MRQRTAPMNHLRNETSPYLLQHADDPVDWYPWCNDVFERARNEDKPVFLSIGYSTCHWCNVMECECFENADTAELLNKSFISVKVDREERPDIDSVYMSVCQVLTGSGGWPMSIFMTWDKKPFFAGTYFPPRLRFGMPGFSDVLNAVVQQWSTDRGRFLRSAEHIIQRVKASAAVSPASSDDNLIEAAVNTLCKSFDREFGGFSQAPKFPMSHNLLFLMYYSTVSQDSTAMKIIEKTLTQMRKGGIFD